MRTLRMAKEPGHVENQMQASSQSSSAPLRRVFCKPYHAPRVADDPGRTRRNEDTKSRCPSWASNPELQQALIDEALEDSGGMRDCRGRPKKLWNAVEQMTFIAVSCNLADPMYNCYPETPPDGKLVAELLRRAERSRDDIPRRVGNT